MFYFLFYFRIGCAPPHRGGARNLAGRLGALPAYPKIKKSETAVERGEHPHSAAVSDRDHPGPCGRALLEPNGAEFINAGYFTCIELHSILPQIDTNRHE